MIRNRLSTDNTPRHCSRCGDELTDLSSREAGVGPVCRKKDSHLYAKAIKANYATAVTHAMSVHAEMLTPEVQAAWMTAYIKILKAAEKAANRTEGTPLVHQDGADLREVVRTCDLLCSYDHPRVAGREAVRTIMVRIIDALGYVGLAAVISGKASTSPSKVWFDATTGRLNMTGLGNKTGFCTMRKIPGIVTPKFRGDRRPYSAPAAYHKMFLSAVQVHWPIFEGDIEALTNECIAHVEATKVVAQPVVVPVAKPVPVTSGAVITVRSDDVVLKFNWVKNANMFGFLGVLKGLCKPAERSYNPDSKEWSFLLCHLDALVEAIEKTEIYGKPAVVSSKLLTPTGLYGVRPKHFGYRRPEGMRGGLSR